MKIITVTAKVTKTDHVATGQSAMTQRKSNGFSLREVAKAMGISAPYLSDLERGRRNWSEQLSRDFHFAITGLIVHSVQVAQKKAHKTNFLIGAKSK